MVACVGVQLHGVGTELLSSSEGRGVAGGYGCDGGALRWLSVVLQIERGREPERAKRGIAVGDDSVASLEGSGRKQEVARGRRRWPRQRRRPSATRAAYWRGEDDRRGAPGGLGRLLQQAAQVGAR